MRQRSIEGSSAHNRRRSCWPVGIEGPGAALTPPCIIESERSESDLALQKNRKIKVGSEPGED